ncbi:MAG: ATP-binding protein [Anaerolineales bacterium]|nr:ATP-binding protein [Anaerolineales bacterium]
MNKHVKDQDSGFQVFNVNFITDVHLVQILGEQLIRSEKIGILELIKNAYDAGATECEVWIEKVPGLKEVEFSDPQIEALEGPVITIIDNGSGMNENIIKDGWLRPATRIKTSIKEYLKKERKDAEERGTISEYEAMVKELRRAYGGRLPLGEKGVGRFATHRLGRHLILQTKAADETNEWILEINWDDFIPPDDAPHDLQDIKLKLVKQKPQRYYGPTNSGTMLRIFGGREGYEWTEDTLKEVGQSIAHLRSPSKSPTGFNTTFHIPQITDEFNVLTETTPAPFKCLAIVDREGKADIEILFTPPSSLSVPIGKQTWPSETVDLRTKDIKYWHSGKENELLRVPSCGSFYMELKLWIRSQEWIDYADFIDFRDYLDLYGGIGIFRDGLMIMPAELSSRDDWLDLSKRHIKKGSNISYYQMSGSVDILQEDTLELIDRTSREGMLDTQSFKDLAKLVKEIVLELERTVQETRDRYRRMKRGRRLPTSEYRLQGETISHILEALSSNYDYTIHDFGLEEILNTSENPKKTVAKLEELKNILNDLVEEVKDLEDQIDILLQAAGYGIAIAVAIHEIEKVTSNLYFGIKNILKKPSSLDANTFKEIERLSYVSQSLLNELRRLAPLRVTRLERKKKFKVRDCILAAQGAFKLSWDDLGIHYYPPSKTEDFEVFGSFGACSQVIANIFDNSTYWLQTMLENNRKICVRMNSSERKVVIADSGPGISDKMRNHLFELYYSTKDPPSGLGLYISKYYMNQMRGAIRESLDPEKIPGFTGAHFTMLFPEEGTK